MSSENAELMAQRLLRAAAMLGEIQNDLDNLARDGAAQITAEQESYETIILTGADVMYALRSLAMRFDRAALAKFDE